jgi:hypothetical protein
LRNEGQIPPPAWPWSQLEALASERRRDGRVRNAVASTDLSE